MVTAAGALIIQQALPYLAPVGLESNVISLRRWLLRSRCFLLLLQLFSRLWEISRHDESHDASGALEDADGLLVADVGVQGLAVDCQDLIACSKRDKLIERCCPMQFSATLVPKSCA